MIIEIFEAGPVATNGYLVADRQGGKALVIDAPQGVASLMVEQVREWNTPITHLVNTHAHWDHFLDNAELLRLTGAKFGIHRESAPLLTLPQARYFGLDLEIEPTKPDFLLEEGEVFEVGELRFELLHCPGHCPGSVVLFERKERAAFVGTCYSRDRSGARICPGEIIKCSSTGSAGSCCRWVMMCACFRDTGR